MTEVHFYHLTRSDPERALPQLLGRTLAIGQRALVLCGSEQRVLALDDALWQCTEPDWLPHGTAADADAELQPVLLTTEEAAVNGARFLFLVDGARSAHLGAYDRVFDLFNGQDETATAAARQRWIEAKAEGHAVVYWQQSASGWRKSE